MAEVPEIGINYQDIGEGRTHRHKISYADLTDNLKDKITEADLTEHELLEQIVITMNKINIHLMAGSDIDLENDILWP